MNIDLLIDKAYVESSSYRVRAMKAIGTEFKTPTQIGEGSGIRVNHISNTLRELKNKKLVECVNENRRKGRLYHLTEKGHQILENLE